MMFKGDSLVLVGTEGQRSPFGSWVSTYNYEGIAQSAAALANSQPIGVAVTTHERGAVVAVGLTYAPDSFKDKWEVDRENLDKDLMYNIAFKGLSDGAKAEIKRWRGDPAGSDLFVTPGVPIPTIPLAAGQTALQLVAGDIALMLQVKALVLRGAEAYQLSTLILKRTRVMSVSLAPTIGLSEQTQFYSTAALAAATGMDAGLAATLPTDPYAPPADTAWGWLPRQANRSYVSKGQMEEHTDWVFAAWSTVLYAYVA